MCSVYQALENMTYTIFTFDKAEHYEFYKRIINLTASNTGPCIARGDILVIAKAMCS